MGIRHRRAAPASPWQNGFVERRVMDHIIVLDEIVLGEAHLRRILKSYAD
jgi:hypothetical protein